MTGEKERISRLHMMLPWSS